MNDEANSAEKNIERGVWNLFPNPITVESPGLNKSQAHDV